LGRSFLLGVGGLSKGVPQFHYHRYSTHVSVTTAQQGFQHCLSGQCSRVSNASFKGLDAHLGFYCSKFSKVKKIEDLYDCKTIYCSNFGFFDC
jgi:hypothetical protein